MVLSDSLLVVYENTNSGLVSRSKKYNRLMRKLALPYKTNKEQLIRARDLGLNEIICKRLLPALCQEANRNDDLDSLVRTTSLKLILTEEEDVELPYINYKSKFTNNELSIFLKADESRDSLIRYLQFLCVNATKITICDNYFAHNWDNTNYLFRGVFPINTLNIEYVETHSELTVTRNSEKITQDFLTGIHSNWIVARSNLYENSHDRYLRIEGPEGKVEVMISSGFEHIWKSKPKEITCVIREVS